jgi:multiple sugar transport system substrate-binding protein
VRITFRLLAALTAMALLLTGCGQDGGDAEPAANEQVELTYFTFSAAPDHLKDLDAIVTAFQAKNPNIKINVQTAAYDQYFTRLQTSVAGGKAPDTFELNYENFITYADNRALLDVTSMASAGDGFDPARVYPEAYKAFQRDGKLYGLPATFSTVVLFYNKKLFDEAGVGYPTADWTWEDELAAARKLTDESKGVWGTFQPVQFFEFYKTVAQNGGRFLSEDGTKAVFNDAAGVAAADYLIGKPGKVMPTLADIGGTPDYDTNLFKSNKLAMWHNGIWQFTGLEDAGVDYDVVTEPGSVQKANAVFMNAAVASATTKHPDAAFKWLAFLAASEDAVKTRLASSWELPAVSDEAAFSSYLSQSPPANREAVFDALDAIALPPVIEKQQQMQDTVTKALEKAASGQATTKQALDEAAAEVDKLLG